MESLSWYLYLQMRDNNFGICNNHWLIILNITSLTNHSKLFWQIAPNWFEKCSLQIARRKITQVKINPAWQSHHHQYCRSGLQVKYIFRIWKVLHWALIPGKSKIVLTINSFLCKDCESFRAQSPLQLGKIQANISEANDVGARVNWSREWFDCNRSQSLCLQIWRSQQKSESGEFFLWHFLCQVAPMKCWPTFLHQKLLFTVDRNKPAVLKDGRSDFNFSNITKLNLIKQ